MRPSWSSSPAIGPSPAPLAPEPPECRARCLGSEPYFDYTRGCYTLGAFDFLDYASGLACAPGGFAYEPVHFENGDGESRVGDPTDDGVGKTACTGPVYPGTEQTCRTHDYGYDLIRAGALPPSAKALVDATFVGDLGSLCPAQGGLTGRVQAPTSFEVCAQMTAAAGEAVRRWGDPQPGQVVGG